jgi:CRISPR-associated endonuclease Csn1
VSTYTAYQLIRDLGKVEGEKRLYSRTLSISGKPLVMRLQIDDTVRMKLDDRWVLMRMVKVKSNGSIYFAEHNEANVDARDRNKENPFSYISKTASSLQKTLARKVMVSPIGELKTR